MKSQLEVEEAKQEIKELLIKYGFPTYGVGIDPTQKDKIRVVSKRDDMPEEEGIFMVITRCSEQNWTITDESVDRTRPPHTLKDKEEVLEFIENTLRERVKCCG